jgi:hypothetical protein
MLPVNQKFKVVTGLNLQIKTIDGRQLFQRVEEFGVLVYGDSYHFNHRYSVGIL